MQLQDLLRDVELVEKVQFPTIEISGISYDSRKVKAEHIFVAIEGIKTDGNHYVEQAMSFGARAVLSENPKPKDFQWPWIQVRRSRQALAQTAANFHAHPTQELRLVGITGTNGKTSIAYLLESILKATGARVGLISTIECRGPDWAAPSEHTTPESLDVQALLHRFCQSQCRDVVMEVSSHALAMDRVYACRFSVAIFSNLTPEHLDYHHSMDSYFEAKRRLFVDTGCGPPKIAIVNLDDSRGKILAKTSPGRPLTFSKNQSADFQVIEYRSGWDGIQVRFKLPCEELEVNTGLLGSFNLSNLLAAVAAASCLGVAKDALKLGIERCGPIPGRFEEINCGQAFHLIVDYAHTPDALQTVLRTARELLPRRVLVLFGCGGERDRSKRPMMASIAEKWSDWVMLTSDNPRSEDPLAIIKEVQAGFQSNRYTNEPDRSQAIRRILLQAAAGDVVILAGKGHEIQQELAGQVEPFDDRRVARTILREMGYGN